MSVNASDILQSCAVRSLCNQDIVGCAGPGYVMRLQVRVRLAQS